MKIKELQKTVNIAWSPQQQYPIYLAAGTAAQQFDSNTSANLEIYATNFSDPSFDLELKASLPSQYRFQKILWCPTGIDKQHANGLIVGGCEGGHVMIHSAQKMLSNEESLLARQDKHTGPVTGLDFNPFQTNLLATCASESEIFIWDLNNTTTHMNPGAKTQPFEDVQNVAWNRQVQHILASVFSSRCVIWDLRKSEQIIKLSDTQSRVRWHAIQWHPDIATQVWLASEDDQAPVVQMWDLRYATAPAKTMQIHQRGILGMSWCPEDIDIMVSCGKDNRIYCWNPNTEIPEGEILSELATTATWYSDVKFCPRNPALIASSSLDGNVSIYSLFGGTQHQVETAKKIADSFPGMDQFAQAPMPQQSTQIVYQDLKIPLKWFKRPVGSSFGFGGKLLTFNNTTKKVNVFQVVTEQEMVERANALEHSLNEANFPEYCRKRADEMNNQNGRYLWYFIKANFELNPKEEMLNLLGYNRDDIQQKFSKYTKENKIPQTEVDRISQSLSHLTHSDSSDIEYDAYTIDKTDLNTEDSTGVFDNIAAEQKQLKENDHTKSNFIIPAGEHADSLLTEALLTGNLDAAVELCFNSQRPTEALIIASTAGIDFLTKIQNRYLEKSSSELSQVIAAMVSRNWMGFINTCSVDSWKEALVASLKHGDRKVVDICERLGDRMVSERSHSIEYMRNAMLCYICAGSIDKIITIWYKIKQLEKQNSNYKLNTEELQDLAEVVMLISKSLEQQGIVYDLTDRFAEFIAEYSSLLVSQGALTTALSYLFALGNNEHPAVDALRDRIHNTVNNRKMTGINQVKGSSAFQKQIPYSLQRHTQAQQQTGQVLATPIQQRRSFSQTQPFMYSGTMQTANTTQTQPFQPNLWSAAGQVPPPSYSTNIPSVSAAQPLLSTQTDVMSQPPRPASNASSQGGSGGLYSRSKYLLDPSVAPKEHTGFGNNTGYNTAPLPVHPQTPSNNTLFNTNPVQPQQQQSSFLQQTNFPNYHPTFAGSYGAGIMEPPQLIQPPPFQNMQRNPTPPPGWNDPPALSSRKLLNKPEQTPAAAPITHPIFGVDPNQNQNGYMNPNQYQQLQMSTMPPPSAGLPNGSAGVSQNNNNAIPPQKKQNFQMSAIPTVQNQQSQTQQHTWNQQRQSIGYTEQPAPIQRQTEPPKEKPPLPEEYFYMQTVLEELKNQCLHSASDPRTKRKFVDVAKRLENLYDCLRDGRLTTATISALNQMVQYIQIGDYANALQTQTQIAFGTDFSQCAGFMPGIKVLVQSASDLQVFLR